MLDLKFVWIFYWFIYNIYFCSWFLHIDYDAPGFILFLKFSFFCFLFIFFIFLIRFLLYSNIYRVISRQYSLPTYVRWHILGPTIYIYIWLVGEMISFSIRFVSGLLSGFNCSDAFTFFVFFFLCTVGLRPNLSSICINWLFLLRFNQISGRVSVLKKEIQGKRNSYGYSKESIQRKCLFNIPKSFYKFSPNLLKGYEKKKYLFILNPFSNERAIFYFSLYTEILSFKHELNTQ